MATNKLLYVIFSNVGILFQKSHCRPPHAILLHPKDFGTSQHRCAISHCVAGP